MPFKLEYLQTIVFILVIAALVQLVEMILKKFIKPLYQALGVYLPLITTNCAVLGVAISNIDSGYNFAESMANSFGISVGFLIAIVILAGIREKSENNNIPKAFQGTPMVLLAAGLMAQHLPVLPALFKEVEHGNFSIKCHYKRNTFGCSYCWWCRTYNWYSFRNCRKILCS